GKDVGLDLRELLLGDLGEFETHLGRKQLLAQRGVVVQLGVDGGRHLVEHEPDPADQEGVYQDHVCAQGPTTKAQLPRPNYQGAKLPNPNSDLGFGNWELGVGSWELAVFFSEPFPASAGCSRSCMAAMGRCI